MVPSQLHLIVQFEDDPINQGLRLARALLAARNADGGSPKNAMTGAIAAPEDDNDCRQDQMPAAHGMKFARLLGGHLMPVTLRGDIARMIPGGAISLLSSSYDFILGKIVDNGGGQVASYIRSLNAR